MNADVIAAIVIISDIWGWDSGRVRHIADWFASMGYYAVIPKILPPFEGGTDDDGLPPGFDLSKRGSELGSIFGGWGYDVVGPKLDAVFSHLKTLGITRAAMIGFCYGGWVCARHQPFEPMVKAVVSPHPSMQLEGWLMNKEENANEKMAAKVTCPVLLMPAGGDPESYHENGSIFKAFPNKASETHLYKNMAHGWVTRGSLASEGVADAVKDALERSLGFINKHLFA